ncbi:hypothetical protein EYF80_021237 [Liparis tanakae]|uniref:Uncharacterized protein n=1 Tax=Liparis tanakae TaxID=230148 RepID=A0A4Z2HSR3_9TELE|nr:hypothetical protein EYF80_021237 [Liparis tanakae]
MLPKEVVHTRLLYWYTISLALITRNKADGNTQTQSAPELPQSLRPAKGRLASRAAAVMQLAGNGTETGATTFWGALAAVSMSRGRRV